MSLQHPTGLQISNDEYVERLYTEVEQHFSVDEDWPNANAPYHWPEGIHWIQGTTYEIIFQWLGSYHSRGCDWLMNTFRLRTLYERKGGGLHPDAPPVPPRLRPCEGVEMGCGEEACEQCYELDIPIDLVMIEYFIIGGFLFLFLPERDEQEVIEIQTIRDDSAPSREYVTQYCERAGREYISPPIKIQGQYTYILLEIRSGFMADLYFHRPTEILHVKQPYIPFLKHIDLWIKQRYIGPETKLIEHILYNPGIRRHIPNTYPQSSHN